MISDITIPREGAAEFSVNPASTAFSEELVQALPILKPIAPNKKSIVATFVASMEIADAVCKDLGTFLDNCVTSGIHVYCEDNHARSLFDKARHHFTIPKIQLLPTQLLEWDLMAKPAEEILRICKESAETRIREVVQAFFEVLNQMAEANYFGLWERHADDPTVCRYYFYRMVARQLHSKDKITTRYERRNASTPGIVEEWEVKQVESFLQEKLLYERHEHQLYDSAAHDWPASHIRMPGFIKTLVNSVPVCLRKHVKIVAGEMVKEEVKFSKISERTISIMGEEKATMIRRGLLISPAVVIDRFVVAGWSDSDF